MLLCPLPVISSRIYARMAIASANMIGLRGELHRYAVAYSWEWGRIVQHYTIHRKATNAHKRQ